MNHTINRRRSKRNPTMVVCKIINFQSSIEQGIYRLHSAKYPIKSIFFFLLFTYSLTLFHTFKHNFFHLLFSTKYIIVRSFSFLGFSLGFFHYVMNLLFRKNLIRFLIFWNLTLVITHLLTTTQITMPIVYFLVTL